METAKEPSKVFHLQHPRDVRIVTEIIGGLRPTEKKPWVVTISHDDESRSLKQNRLSFMWYKYLGKETGNGLEYERAYCKLTHGVPLLREDKDFNEFYCTALAPLDYDRRLDAMEFVPVTSLMKVKQFAEYLSMIEKVSAARGIVLPTPEDLYWNALMREGERRDRK